jgi:hypothetical protein
MLVYFSSNRDRSRLKIICQAHKMHGTRGTRAYDWFCALCEDPLKEPVLLRCGHVFCWQCLSPLLNSAAPVCPSCGQNILIEETIPIYGQGREADPGCAPRPKHECKPPSDEGWLKPLFGMIGQFPNWTSLVLNLFYLTVFWSVLCP